MFIFLLTKTFRPMKNHFLESAKYAVKHWWVSILIGVLSIILGIMFIRTPIDALLTLSIVFAISFLATGISEIIFAIANRKTVYNWGWSLAGGIVDVLLGVLLLSAPDITALLLVYFVGFWILFRSIWGIGIAFELSRFRIPGWGLMLILAVLGVMLSFVFILSPIFGGGFIVAFAATAFIVYGIFRIYLGFKLKSTKNWLDKNLKLD